MRPGILEATRPRLYRFLYIDKNIKTGKYPNSHSLAKDLGVSRRTILRDVEFMRYSFSAPLEYCPKNRGYYYTEAEYSLGLLKLTEGELLALFLGHNLLTQCKGTPYGAICVAGKNQLEITNFKHYYLSNHKQEDFFTNLFAFGRQ